MVRAAARYGEQTCNHYIAFKLLAVIRDRVFRTLRKLCPAKLEGRNRGDLISLITSDIELLEVFYAHTISPVAIAVLFCAGMCLFIGSYSVVLGLIALAAYLTVGLLIPVIVSKMSGDDGMKFRSGAGHLERLCPGQTLQRIGGDNPVRSRRTEAKGDERQNGPDFERRKQHEKSGGKRRSFHQYCHSDLRSSDVVCGISIALRLWRR